MQVFFRPLFKSIRRVGNENRINTKSILTQVVVNPDRLILTGKPWQNISTVRNTASYVSGLTRQGIEANTGFRTPESMLCETQYS